MKQSKHILVLVSPCVYCRVGKFSRHIFRIAAKKRRISRYYHKEGEGNHLWQQIKQNIRWLMVCRATFKCLQFGLLSIPCIVCLVCLVPAPCTPLYCCELSASSSNILTVKYVVCSVTLMKIYFLCHSNIWLHSKKCVGIHSLYLLRKYNL